MAEGSTAVLSIGSNLGDRLGYLRLAVNSLAEPDGVEVVAISSVYETAPWGGVDQDDFLNITVVARAEAYGPFDWLAAGRKAEAAAERTREVRWGPRTLDVDVIVVRDGYGAAVSSADPELILPHPRAGVRAFVLVPWLEVEPSAELPGHGPVAALTSGLGESETSAVRRRDDLMVVETR